MSIDTDRIVRAVAEAVLDNEQEQQPAKRKRKRKLLSAPRALLVGAGVYTAGRLLARGGGLVENLQERLTEYEHRLMGGDEAEPEPEDEDFDEDEDEEPVAEEDEEPEGYEDDEPEDDFDEDEPEDEFEDEEPEAEPEEDEEPEEEEEDDEPESSPRASSAAGRRNGRH